MLNNVLMSSSSQCQAFRESRWLAGHSGGNLPWKANRQFASLDGPIKEQYENTKFWSWKNGHMGIDD